MPRFTTRRVVRHSPARMFDLVADVERFPEFLPLCESLIVEAREKTAACERIAARMCVGYGPVHECFTTEVRLLREQGKIAVRYLEGPFRRLDNTWDFLPHADGCEVLFFIDYEFRSFALQLLMGAMFDRAFRKFAQAFEARADALYGRQGA